MKCSPQYYDTVFRMSPAYRGDYDQSPYFELWQKLIELMPFPIHRIIDLGCGPGQFAEMLHDNNPGYQEYWGFDFSPVAIREVEMKFKDIERYKFTLCDLETSPIPWADCYVACEILEHIEGDLALLEKLLDNAYIVASVPDFPYVTHVRYFSSVAEVRKQYGYYVKFDKLFKMGNWFIFSGTLKTKGQENETQNR
jgi:trans-aconitate methyltransferase